MFKTTVNIIINGNTNSLNQSNEIGISVLFLKFWPWFVAFPVCGLYSSILPGFKIPLQSKTKPPPFPLLSSGIPPFCKKNCR